MRALLQKKEHEMQKRKQLAKKKAKLANGVLSGTDDEDTGLELSNFSMSNSNSSQTISRASLNAVDWRGEEVPDPAAEIEKNKPSF